MVSLYQPIIGKYRGSPSGYNMRFAQAVVVNVKATIPNALRSCQVKKLFATAIGLWGIGSVSDGSP